MNVSNLLKDSKLKKTSCRKAILNLIMQTGKPLSEKEIKDKLSDDYDRTTFYRTLKTLEKHNIIHKIIIDKNVVKYAVGYPEQHAHFYCNLCNNITCIEVKPQKSASAHFLPKGFIAEKVEILIKGKCNSCCK